MYSFTSSIICNRVPGLSTAQRQLCSEIPDAFVALGAGHMLGAQECQHQFKGKTTKYFDSISPGTNIVSFCFIFFRSSMELQSSLEERYIFTRCYSGWVPSRREIQEQRLMKRSKTGGNIRQCRDFSFYCCHCMLLNTNCKRSHERMCTMWTSLMNLNRPQHHKKIASNELRNALDASHKWRIHSATANALTFAAVHIIY